MADNLLKIESLTASYGRGNVLTDISLEIPSGGILCVVGESGSGKSSLIKAIHGMGDLEIVSGRILFEGRDLAHMKYAERKRLMGGRIGLIPQNPAASFNPIRRISVQLKEALESHDMAYEEARITGMLCDIGIKDGAEVLKSRPYELSGGMNQRIAITAAMMFEPALLLCDEATSALDVTTQGAVVRDLMRAGDKHGTAILMVTHHLGIARMMADRIGIMKDGRIIEYGETGTIFEDPQEEYTKELMRSVPRLRGNLQKGN